MREEFDLASYPKSIPFYDSSNNKVEGKFKDEASGSPITEFVGLKPKMYSYQTLTDPSLGRQLSSPRSGRRAYNEQRWPSDVMINTRRN